MNYKELIDIAKSLVKGSKGILAADESTGTITKRFSQINLESTFENRRKYRELLLTTNNLGKYISGVILYDETIRQNDSNGNSFVNVLNKEDIHAGIKVDLGVKSLFKSKIEKITEGLDGLNERMQEYSKIGATFAKWRAVVNIKDDFPSDYCLKLNADSLGRYARIVQENGMVPIIEPEIIMEGEHSIDKCFEVTSKMLKFVFKQLLFHEVFLEGILLKPNMIVSGTNSKESHQSETIASKTLMCLNENVPNEVPGIVFLSGGQSDEKATENLNEINKNKGLSWKLSFSYGRALQKPVLQTWKGLDVNIEESQNSLLKRAKLNFLAAEGKYNPSME